MRKFISLILFVPLFVGCASIETAVSKRNLDVQNKMSATVFLDPVDDDKDRTVFINVHNTSDKRDFDLRGDLGSALIAKGYHLVDKINDAHYMVQVNVLQVGKSSQTAAEAAVYRGYGMDGAALGAGTASAVGASSSYVIGGAMLGGLASVVADSAVKDVYFSAIVDIQIKERLAKGQKADQDTVHWNQSGTSGSTRSAVSEKSDWKICQTRILSSANKVNLDFTEALPLLKQGISQSIAGIF